MSLGGFRAHNIEQGAVIVGLIIQILLAKMLGRSSCFGEIALISEDNKRTATVIICIIRSH